MESYINYKTSLFVRDKVATAGTEGRPRVPEDHARGGQDPQGHHEVQD